MLLLNCCNIYVQKKTFVFLSRLNLISWLLIMILFNFSPTSWTQEKCPVFEFIISSIVIGSISIVGLILNTLSYAVLNRDKNNEVATFLLKVANLQTAFLFSFVFVTSFHFKECSNFRFRIFHFVSYAFIFCSIMIMLI